MILRTKAAECASIIQKKVIDAECKRIRQAVLNTLAAEDPKIYIGTVTWHDRAADLADDRIGFLISTHAVYNNVEQLDYLFERLEAAVDAAGHPQLS